MQLRGFVNMREAIKSEAQREKDAKPSGPMHDLVARVQYMNQHDLTEAEMLAEEEARAQ